MALQRAINTRRRVVIVFEKRIASDMAENGGKQSCLQRNLHCWIGRVIFRPKIRRHPFCIAVRGRLTYINFHSGGSVYVVQQTREASVG